MIIAEKFAQKIHRNHASFPVSLAGKWPDFARVFTMQIVRALSQVNRSFFIYKFFKNPETSTILPKPTFTGTHTLYKLFLSYPNRETCKTYG